MPWNPVRMDTISGELGRGYRANRTDSLPTRHLSRSYLSSLCPLLCQSEVNWHVGIVSESVRKSSLAYQFPHDANAGFRIRAERLFFDPCQLFG